MTILEFSPAERAAGKPTRASIETAKEALERDGVVVLNDIVDLDHIATIRDRMLEDLPKVLNRKDAPFNFTKSNVQQDPPPFHPYLFEDVLLNEFVIAVTESVLGPGLYNAYYSGNTALPNTEQRQPVHADLGHLWANSKVATPAYALVVNIPLVDMGAFNGSTEIWPGTHLDTSVAMQAGDITVAEDRLEAQRRVEPPLQPEVKAGSVVIRDIRMWHAGMPNPSDQPRPMIAMIHWVGWWHPGEQPTFPAETREFFEHPVLLTKADFVEGPIDYLGNNEAFDMQPSAR